MEAESEGSTRRMNLPYNWGKSSPTRREGLAVNELATNPYIPTSRDGLSGNFEKERTKGPNFIWEHSTGNTPFCFLTYRIHIYLYDIKETAYISRSVNPPHMLSLSHCRSFKLSVLYGLRTDTNMFILSCVGENSRETSSRGSSLKDSRSSRVYHSQLACS